jgi:Zn-finger nucleic acid-binding protein
MEMTAETVGDVTIDRCSACHGIWLDILELEELLQADPRSLLAEDRCFQRQRNEQGKRLNCPRCQGTYLIKLNSRQRPGTIVDSCTVCFGMWLDAGELTWLAHADLAGRVRALFGC